MPPTRSKDALKHGAIYASAGGSFVAAGPVITDDHGLPRRRFLKDLIRVGDWHAGGTEHKVTPERLSGWAAKFTEMSGKGVEVPAPVEHTSDPKERRGTVHRMWVDGDTLMGEIELVGEDALRMAAAGTKVSIYAPPSVSAGDGTKWQDAIEHVALTDYPVVSGQANFIPIAASKGGTVNVPVLRMAKEISMDWKKTAQIIGFDIAGLDDTTGPTKLEEALTKLAADHKAGTAQVATLTASLKTATDQAAALSKTAGIPEVDPDIIQARTETISAKLESLVAADKITPATAKLALSKLTEGKAAGLCLSSKAATAAGLAAPFADVLLEILAANDPKDRKAKTGLQNGTALSRKVEDGKADPNAANPEALARFAKLAGIKTA